MRDIALSAVFAVLFTLALRHTWVGAMLWTWFSLMNPHKLTYGFAFSMPFAAAAAGATLLSIFWNTKQLRLPADPSVLMLVLFLVWVCIATAFAIHPTDSLEDLIVTLKIQLMTLVCLAALRGRKLIELFIWVNVVSVGFYGVKGGIFAIATGGASRVWGPTEGMIQGNNEIGLALTMVIPLMNYLRVTSVNKWVRWALLASMLLSAVAVLATQSRGAFLAIAAMGLVLWFRSSKKVLGALVMVLVATSLLAFMPQSWEDRMNTISSFRQDGSAIGRLNAWELALNVANTRITGAGYAIETQDIFTRFAPDPTMILTAHSIYFQVLGEQGWIGLVLFLSLGALSFWNAARLRKESLKRQQTEWLHDLASMIQVSMVGYAVGGAFLSLSYFDLPYNVLVMLVAAKYWLREQTWKTEPRGLFESDSSRGVLRAKQGGAKESAPAANVDGKVARR
jgi:putative inorganic carbon (hco3(-)) transporter